MASICSGLSLLLGSACASANGQELTVASAPGAHGAVTNTRYDEAYPEESDRMMGAEFGAESAPTNAGGAAPPAHDDAPSAPPARQATVVASPSPVAPEVGVDEVSQSNAALDRQIIYTAQLQVSVYDVEVARQQAEQLVERVGGYIQMLSDNMVALRIPSAQLRPAMAEIAGYGIVTYRNLQAQDVTAEFVDLQSRLRALEETREQLLALIKRAHTVEEVLKVREALDRVTAELEVLKGRMRQLEHMISFSSLQITFHRRGPATAATPSNDPFPWVNELGVEATEWN